MDSVFESVEHGAAIPARVFVTQLSRCAFHWHHDYEVILILKGSVTVYCGAEPVVLSAGDLYLFNTKAIHGIQRTAEDNLLLCLQFSPAALGSRLDAQQFYHHFYLDSTSDAYRPSLPYRHFSEAMARIALANQRTAETAALRTYSLLLDFLADLLDHVPYDIRRTALGRGREFDNTFLNDILVCIHDNLRTPNLTQAICRRFGMSEKSLYRYLKTALGLSFKELFDIVRVEQACAMLTETQKSLSYIWEICGFSSEVSFYRNFKKQMGVTPREYRGGGRPASPGGGDGESYDCFNLGEATELLHGILNAPAEGGRQ